MSLGVQWMGCTRAAAPRINRMLAILEPTTLPTEMPGAPLSAASTLTTNSGAVVP